MNNYTRGYQKDAGVDIILEEHLIIRPGFQIVELPAQYTPGDNEVAFVIARGSTLKKGVMTCMWAIDTGYTGKISAAVFNASKDTHVFDPGDRPFGVVNLQLGKDRVKFTITKEGERGDNKFGSSGGTK